MVQLDSSGVVDSTTWIHDLQVRSLKHYAKIAWHYLRWVLVVVKRPPACDLMSVMPLSELSASLYYHLCKQTQCTCSLLNVSRMNVEHRMSLIASCQMSVKNLSSHASYNWGIWKAIILLFMFRACGPLVYSTITSLVLHRCLDRELEMLLKTFLTSTCTMTQSKCRLRKTLMPKMMVS